MLDFAAFFECSCAKMPILPPSLQRATTPRQTVPRVDRIASPLTSVGYGLAPDHGHLIWLMVGALRIGPQNAPEMGPVEGARLLWRPARGRAELLAQSGTRAVIVSVPRLALTQALPTTPLGDQMRRVFGQELDFAADDMARLDGLIQGLEAETKGFEPGAEPARDHYLALILMQLWRLARADLVAHGHAPQGLAERFVLTAGQRVRDHLSVGDYATDLGVSRDRLGSAVRRATGLSPQAYLHLLLVREASELLANTGMPVSQVAFRLGFADPAYFTRFFTRHRGESPARFRRAAKERRAAGDISYAAWP